MASEHHIMMEMGWTEDRHRAYLALRTVLQTLRDRMTPEEAAHLSAQLPMLVRGFYYEGWNPSGKPDTSIDKKAFLDEVQEGFRLEEVEAEWITRGVFKVLFHRATKGEIEDVEQVPPKGLSELFPRPREVSA
jgi:uncharacterized protein (DUF2267 family)